MKSFNINIVYDFVRLKFLVEQIGVTRRNESYRIIGSNNTWVVKNNFPLRNNGYHRDLLWTFEGELWNIRFKDLITAELEKELNSRLD